MRKCDLKTTKRIQEGDDTHEILVQCAREREVFFQHYSFPRKLGLCRACYDHVRAAMEKYDALSPEERRQPNATGVFLLMGEVVTDALPQDENRS